MSDIVAIFQGLDEAYAKKTLRLLKSPRSQMYLAMFKTLFPDRSQGIVEEVLFSRMDECLADLYDSDYGDQLFDNELPLKTGRSLCHDLIDRYNWVESKRREDGQMEYRLTSDAIEALDTVERLCATDATMTGSRMRTILEQIDRAYLRLSPDREARRQILVRRFEDAQRELEEFDKTGGSQAVSPEEAKDEIANLIDLMSGLPVDMRRLEEDMQAKTSDLLSRFREDVRPAGEIVGDYLQEGRQLLNETDYGRSFGDALSVMSSRTLVGEVDEKLDAIAEVPQLVDCAWDSARQLQESWNQVSNGIAWVNRESARSSQAIYRSLSRHDVARDRELTSVLKDLEAAAYAWAERVGPRETSAAIPSVGGLEAHALRARPFVPGVSAPPPEIETEVGDIVLSLEDLRRIGGPLTGEVLDAIAASLPLGTKEIDLAAAFSHLSDDKRRPVEIAGLMQLATSLGVDVDRGVRAEYACLSLDGRPVVWRGPRIVLTTAQMDEGRSGLQ